MIPAFPPDVEHEIVLGFAQAVLGPPDRSLAEGQ